MFTIQLFPSTFLILFLFVFLITFVLYSKKNEKMVKLFFVGMFEIYILYIFSVAILPIRILNPDLLENQSTIRNYFQLIPFRSIYSTIKNASIFSIQIIGNIVLLLPFPIFLGYLKMNSKRYAALFFQSLCISIFIEVLQVIIDFILQYPSRKFDVDDIILNGTGIMLGVCIYILIQRMKVVNEWICRNIVYSIH